MGPDYREHVRQARFRRALWGYNTDDVRRHLDAVAGWFSLAGIDEFLDERANEHAARAEQRIAAAESEAARILAAACREADAIREDAREEARATLAEARREAAQQRRGWSRLGRPAGAR